MEKIRCFLAIDLPLDLRKKVTELQRKIQESKPDVKWVEEENLHLSIRFLGEIEEEVVERVKEIAERCAKTFKPFKVSLRSIGVFPSLAYLRVIWVGAEDQEIKRIHDSIDEELQKIGFAKDKKFVPHLTIGRVRSARNKGELLAKLKDNWSAEIGEFEVKEIKLKQSKLTPKGPIYSDIAEFKLG